MKNYKKGSDQRALTIAEYERVSWFLHKTDPTKYAIFQIGCNSSFFYTEISRLKVKNLLDIVKLTTVNEDNLLVYDFNEKDVYIEQKLLPDLEEYIKYLTVRLPNVKPSDPAFYSTKLNPIRHDIISHYIYTLCDQLNIERFHLRKTFFTNLLNRGVSLFNIQRYLKMQNSMNVLKFLNISPSAHFIQNAKSAQSEDSTAEKRIMQSIQEHTRTLLTLKYELTEMKKAIQNLDALCDRTLESLKVLV